MFPLKKSSQLLDITLLSLPHCTHWGLRSLSSLTPNICALCPLDPSSPQYFTSLLAQPQYPHLLLLRRPPPGLPARSPLLFPPMHPDRCVRLMQKLGLGPWLLTAPSGARSECGTLCCTRTNIQTSQPTSQGSVCSLAPLPTGISPDIPLPSSHLAELTPPFAPSSCNFFSVHLLHVHTPLRLTSNAAL